MYIYILHYVSLSNIYIYTYTIPYMECLGFRSLSRWIFPTDPGGFQILDLVLRHVSLVASRARKSVSIELIGVEHKKPPTPVFKFRVACNSNPSL